MATASSATSTGTTVDIDTILLVSSQCSGRSNRKLQTIVTPTQADMAATAVPAQPSFVASMPSAAHMFAVLEGVGEESIAVRFSLSLVSHSCLREWCRRPKVIS